MKYIKLLIVFAVMVPFVANASFLGFLTKSDLENIQSQIVEIQKQLELIRDQVYQPTFGADSTLTIAGFSYYLAGSGISSSASSITLTSLTFPQSGYKIQDSDLSTTFYITLEPGSRTRQEVASCTTATQNADGSATLSGCSRGLLPYSPYTASSTYAFAHGGGTTVVFSNPPQLYNDAVFKGNAAQVSGIWSFASSSLPRASTTPTYGSGDELKFVTYGQLASTSFSGVVDASLTQKGIVEQATKAETAAGTATGGTTAPLFTPTAYFNASSSATTTVPVTNGSGKLDPNFIDGSGSYAFSGTNTHSGSETFTGTKTLSGTTTLTSTSTLNASGTVNFTGATLSGNFPNLVSASTTNVTNSGTNETNIFSVAVPANTLSTGNIVQATVNTEFTTRNTSASNLILRLKYGATNMATSTLTLNATSQKPAGKLTVELFGAGATNAQEGTLFYTFSEATPSSTTIYADRQIGSATEDSTAAKNLVLSVEVSGSGDVFTAYNWYIAKLIR